MGLDLGDPVDQEKLYCVIVAMRLINESEVLTLGNLIDFMKKSDDKDTFKKQKEAHWIIITERCDDEELSIDSRFSYGNKEACQRDIDLLFT